MIGRREGQGSPLKRRQVERVDALRLNVVRCRPVIWRRLLEQELADVAL